MDSPHAVGASTITAVKAATIMSGGKLDHLHAGAGLFRGSVLLIMTALGHGFGVGWLSDTL